MKPLMIPGLWKPSLGPHSLPDRWNCFHKALDGALRGEGLSQLLQAAALKQSSGPSSCSSDPALGEVALLTGNK